MSIYQYCLVATEINHNVYHKRDENEQLLSKTYL